VPVLVVSQCMWLIPRDPFIPAPSSKPPAEIDPNFELHSDKRAKERETYEMHRKAKEAELDARRRQLEDRQRREEEDKVRQMRQQAVHKPTPLPE